MVAPRGFKRYFWLLSNTRAVAIGAWAVAVCILSGCGGGEGSVHGTATLDGHPLAGAQVVFVREDEGVEEAPVVAMTNDQGKYELIGNTGKGIPVGKYAVMVSKEALKDGSVPQGEKLEAARTKGVLKNSLHKSYEAKETTPLHFEVKSGSQKIDLELKKKP